MFNLNIPAASLLSVDCSGLCSTPKTPEIVNTLIAMQNPLDNYTFTTINVTSPTGNNNGNNLNNNSQNNNGVSTIHQQNFNSANQQFISQDSSHSSCSGSPLDSPAGTSTTPSVQLTCSQLIKAGLKLSIQSKRKMSSGDSSSGNEQPSRKYSRKSTSSNNNTPTSNSFNTTGSGTGETNGETSEDESFIDQKPNTIGGTPGLTPEDEDRRRRRRERNKIAATKCRMKKRERTINLISESESLETQNVDLKTQVKTLEVERRKLFEMLQIHACLHPNGYQPPTKLLQSPAYKYLKNLGMGDDDESNNIMEQPPRTVIPPVGTIKYSRNNGMRQQQQHHQLHQNHMDLLPNGYCKSSPTQNELGYLNSPTQDVTSTCHLQQILTNSVTTNGHLQQSNLLKSDYIPNRHDNSNDGTTTVDSTTADFVLKSEFTDSPYTTDKSAERFLCETNFDSFDIKHSNSLNNNINNNNNNINSHNNNHNVLDFHAQLTTNCQSYDHILNIKNDFLANDSELLAQMCEGTESEYTDLDSGISYVHNMTNGGCLA